MAGGTSFVKVRSCASGSTSSTWKVRLQFLVMRCGTHWLSGRTTLNKDTLIALDHIYGGCRMGTVRGAPHRAEGVRVMYHSMGGIVMEPAMHPNNHVPHFPTHCLGSIDTLPVVIHRGRGR